MFPATLPQGKQLTTASHQMSGNYDIDNVLPDQSFNFPQNLRVTLVLCLGIASRQNFMCMEILNFRKFIRAKLNLFRRYNISESLIDSNKGSYQI